MPDEGEPDSRANWINPAQLPVTIDGEESFACPRQPLREQPEWWSRVLLFYGMYQKGHLPERGTVIDQSNKLIQAFTVLDQINQECDRILEEKASRKGGPGKGGRGGKRKGA